MTTPRERLASARRAFGLAASVRGVGVAGASALAVLLTATLVDALVGMPMPLRRLILPLAVAAGGAALIAEALRRIRPALRASDEALALWFEQRLPSLRYALVTAVDPQVASVPPSIMREVEETPLEPEVRRATRRLLLQPLALLAVVTLALLAAPDGAIARVTAPRAGDALARAGEASRAARDPLATIVVRVVPPGYTGLGATSIDDPSSVTALAGSRIVVEGRGDGVTALLESREIAPAQRDGTWRIAFDVPPRAAGLRLRGPARERVLVVESYADSVPVARLDAPTRDSVLRSARGAVALRADLRDDHGLADAAFEYIVSSGAGETYTFRSGRVGARAFAAGAREGRIEGTLLLDTLRLAPGDLIHLRALARDRNDVSGPGQGASETRTIRIARADEYDSVSVDPMPPTEPEKNALSQRMILLMTTELRDRAPRIGSAAVERESRRLAVEQTKLRKRVGEVIFVRLSEDQGEHAHFAGDGHEHGAEKPLDPDQVLAAAQRAANVDPTRQLEGEGDETPVVAINKPLLEAYNHMWRASTELETANPAGAIPWMQRAIEALQRARAAERIYLRGRPPRVVVDLAKVRGTGREKSAPPAREARAPLDADRAARLARFDALLGSIAADPLAAADSLLLLRLSLPGSDRAAAQALDAAADAVRRGGDVTAALQRARRSLAGAPVRQDGLSPWGR
ncbi:MAG: DUF4175 domain-containing protein [Gemmatimonadetes bacterium]|nr:DUF4175 domain-containing protein [Gemmatimonadota bacterium]